MTGDMDKRGDTPAPRIGTVYIDAETGECVMPPDFPGDKELRWPADMARDKRPITGDKPAITCKTSASQAATCKDATGEGGRRASEQSEGPVPGTCDGGRLRDGNRPKGGHGPTRRERRKKAQAQRAAGTTGAAQLVHRTGNASAAEDSVSLDDQLAMFAANCERACSRLRDNLDHGSYRLKLRQLARQRLIDGYALYGDRICRAAPEDVEREASEEIADWLVYMTIGGMGYEP